MPESMHASSRFVSRLTRQTLALILAGGRGSRLQKLTEWRAKPAVPFGGKFRIIDFPLSNCVNSGIRQVGVLTQYKADSLIRHIQQGWGFLRGELGEFIDIMPAQQRLQESWYAGTADAVYQNLDIIRQRDPEFIMILAGDHVYKMDYGLMLAYHVERKADLTIGCMEVPLADAKAFGVMQMDGEQRIRKFVEKPSDPPPMPNRPDHAAASMGIYIFNTAFLFEQLIKDADTPGSNHDFGMDIIPQVIQKYRVFAYRFRNAQSGVQAYWRDVGTVDSYWAANMELIGVDPELNLYDQEWPIWTYQAQTPPAKFVFDDDDRRGMAVDSMVSGGCIISGAEVRHSLLFSNVRVNSFSRVLDSVILPDVNIGRHCRISRAVIDKGCNIPPNTVIGENLEDDRKRFYVSPEGIVLVTPDCLGQRLHFHR
ncbi:MULTISPECIES: glucose-1-phosphate adenylyltransferase [Methylococcus]|jgi:glucose-1-phosphate adenylyltransferase|uniref:Glucose-1-phosphate adenylyltransferase n=1 Tax=Methylococcus capsulatus (strain ATCC 33009 / NCIMB 11132 / Bath) TaxID=243233 RepID=GLGC_METCA|nr:glucose-1-phosphate adenylyltransferase [Methylococcus capsulatus]Q608L6.1 RecName: Full=Glucose-1-phosphate adenylyltransferase; AltName: Full=ADP-glucose pyrophosphorylase; Short=ADPGlc PPase; AltName: Full=ADP-glucose synthase [Methylococcus capsulatus str. Bath]AAU92510.1 glucose-1-phosphate adenylyltransferase [Methylococcus capsulatus str. Bath]QXP87828.1 glucose-1-phosphate adenylyltransferase [Methylococcus capsulatus]QXP90818.1 glucose-1-phosphate adenylyltransferase [Methylococcus 